MQKKEGKMWWSKRKDQEKDNKEWELDCLEPMKESPQYHKNIIKQTKIEVLVPQRW